MCVPGHAWLSGERSSLPGCWECASCSSFLPVFQAPRQPVSVPRLGLPEHLAGIPEAEKTIHWAQRISTEDWASVWTVCRIGVCVEGLDQAA